MSWWMLALPGLLVGCGAAVLVSALAPRHVHVASALTRLGTTTRPDAPSRRDAPSIIGEWAHRHLPDAPGFRIPAADLVLIGMPPAAFLYRKVLGAAVGLLVPLLLGALINLVLPVLPLWIWMAISVVAAVVGWTSPDAEVRTRARRARAEFTRAMAVYVGLVAVELSDGATGPARAMANAASVADSWVFRRIREELTLAEYTGQTQWDALERLAEQIQVPALQDASRIMRLAGDGARVTDSLRGAGDALRNAIVSQAHAEANAQSVKIGPPLALTVFVLAGLFMTPAVMAIIAR
ncbi:MULTISPECIES: hypothetical protein [unclassified Microbacterium]|uniref:hypothetical protein n=1 Tax=unclassified Microbacterium TaxID=2609290 RepID=UPI000C2C071F|nr:MULTISPECIES: hypothetical protein [unclassified Microbacterium]